MAMATRRSSAARFTRSLLYAARSLSHSRQILVVSTENNFSSQSPPSIVNGLPKPFFTHTLVGRKAFSHQLFSFSSRPYSSSAQINNSEFTEMAWEGVVGAVDAARVNKQQVVESEHLMKALLEQKDGLARRILTKAGLDNTSVLQATDDFISQLPKVTGDTSGPIVGPDHSLLLNNARMHKKEMNDDFVSVEHLILAFLSDKRFGQLLFSNLQLSEKALKDAIQAVRGSQRVTDQSITDILHFMLDIFVCCGDIIKTNEINE